MAQGDLTLFQKAKERIGLGQFNFSTGTFKVSIVTAAVNPAAADADPRGVGTDGDPDYTEVDEVGNYVAGGNTIPSTSWALTGGNGKFDGGDMTGAPDNWAQDASNPTDARWGIIYQADANNYALAFLDLGSVFDMTTGDLSITWHANGIMTLT